jgi:hypothetical protein
MIIVMCLACGRRGEPKIPPPHKTADAFITVKITEVETITRTITYAYTSVSLRFNNGVLHIIIYFHSVICSLSFPLTNKNYNLL